MYCTTQYPRYDFRAFKTTTLRLPWWLSGKESACNVGDTVQSLGQEHLLEEDMATHSNVLVWNIPWTEEPGRLQSMESLRVRHD